MKSLPAKITDLRKRKSFSNTYCFYSRCYFYAQKQGAAILITTPTFTMKGCDQNGNPHEKFS